MTFACRLLVDAALSGAWNMAVDEALLESAAEGGSCTLRFYEWSEPTLSLGYFQTYENRLVHRPSRNCPCVRRSSGGGAILHDAELTYSLALPTAHPLASDAMALYRSVHKALIATLADRRIQARLCSESSGLAPGEEPFLCFARRAEGDVLVEGAKICGSAQRRRRGAVLQHGSVLLRTSQTAPELPGIWEAAGVDLRPAELVAAWQRELAVPLGVQFTPGPLTPSELGRTRTLAIEKYNSLGWTRRR